MEPVTLNIPVMALRGLTVFPELTLSFDWIFPFTYTSSSNSSV